MKKITVEIISFVLALFMLMSATNRIAYIHMPERISYGATWHMYRQEPEHTIDIMFVGSSMAYCDIIPARVYRQTGYTSYVVSGPALLPSAAYFYIKEALKTQSPRVIMLEASSFYFKNGENQHSKAALGYMPYGLNRYRAIMASAPESQRLELLFPLFGNHDLWQEHKITDYFKKRPDEKIDMNAGFTPLAVPRPQSGIVEKDGILPAHDYNVNMEYMRRIIELCSKKGIALELIIVPSYNPLPDEAVGRIRTEAGDIPLTDYNDGIESIGLDPEKDFYDIEHLNRWGAVKFTDLLSEDIKNKYDFEPCDHDKVLWQERMEHLDEQ